MDVEELLRKVLEENRKLKERLAEIEGTKGLADPLRPGTGKGGSTEVTKMVKLLEQKDKRLESYAEELEEKQVQLEKNLVELKKKNDGLNTMITSLRMVQEIFEVDPTPMLGLNKEGKVILFNRAAEAVFGPALYKAITKPLSELCPEAAEAAQSLLADGQRREQDLGTPSGGRYHVLLVALGSQRERRGVLLHFTPLPA